MGALFIFNQYYIDFLKRIKDSDKKSKEESELAKKVLKNIKSHYLTLDKLSEEYLIYINENINEEIWENYITNDNWLTENKDIFLYKDISISDIVELINDNYLCNHFISVFYIFKNNISDDLSEKIVKILQTVDSSNLLNEIEDEKIKTILNRLRDLRNKHIKDKSGIDMNFIQDTTLGKLAKEILDDIDVGKLQKSIGENGDVLRAIGDPDSGFADIITNVSKKMATKISNGELKQENLIQDAMKFASIMPNIFGGGNKNSELGGNKTNGPDLSNIMNMMSSMMGGGVGSQGRENNTEDELLNILKNMPKKAPHRSKQVINENLFKKLARTKKLKKKLHDKKVKCDNSDLDSK